MFPNGQPDFSREQVRHAFTQINIKEGVFLTQWCKHGLMFIFVFLKKNISQTDISIKKYALNISLKKS